MKYVGKSSTGGSVYKAERSNLHQIAFDFGKDDDRAAFMKWLDELQGGNVKPDLRRELQEAYYRGRKG